MGALQDNTITEDTTTLCTYDKPRRRGSSLKKKPNQQTADIPSLNLDENPPQFGFENMVFDIDNRCDDQKANKDTPPIRYCSLAQFVEGNDIARKSFKRPNPKKSASKSISSQKSITETSIEITDVTGDYEPKIIGDNLDTIKIQIQGSHVDLTGENESDRDMLKTILVTSGGGGNHGLTASGDVKKTRFKVDESPKHYDDDTRRYPRVSVIVEPPSPSMNDELRIQRINELRRHSSHAPSLSPRFYDKEKDRRHSGYNPNLLTLDSEHMRFLNCSPAASRRISCGSLFKVFISTFHFFATLIFIVITFCI